jgi:hypothetical protein
VGANSLRSNLDAGPKLTGAGTVGKADFGQSVALSADGNTALIGGQEDAHGVGAAWVFTRSGSTWTERGEKLTGSGEINEGAGEFGFSVALSADGNTIAATVLVIKDRVLDKRAAMLSGRAARQ